MVKIQWISSLLNDATFSRIVKEKFRLMLLPFQHCKWYVSCALFTLIGNDAVVSLQGSQHNEDEHGSGDGIFFKH